MAAWHCLIDGQEFGPFSTEQIRALAKSGRLRPQDHLRRSDSEAWTPATKVRGLFDAADSEIPPATASPPVAAADSVSASPVAARAALPPVSSSVPPVASPAPARGLPTAIPLQSPTAAPVASSPMLPVATPIQAGPVTTTDQETRRSTRRNSRQQPYLIFGGLAAALLVLVVVAVFSLGRKPSVSKETPDLAEADPGGSVSAAPEMLETDVEVDPAAVPVEPAAANESTESQLRVPVPNVTRWLEAGVQKRVVRDHMKLHVPAAWWASGPTQQDALVVEIEVTNLAESRPLEYQGWASGRAPGNSSRAIVLGPVDNQPILAEPGNDASSRMDSPQRLAPGQIFTTRIQFRLTARPDTERIRMILPYEAFGLPGNVGFEIPPAMILSRPPESMPPTEPIAASGDGPRDQPGNATAVTSSDRKPETGDDLRSQIRASVAESAGTEKSANDEAPVATSGDVDQSARPPETMKDLRRSIEESAKQPSEVDQQESEPNLSSDGKQSS